MENRVYKDRFESWNDLRQEFGEFNWSTNKTDTKVPEEEPLYVFAVYSYECYEGDCEVFFSHDGVTFFTNPAAHCSCFGLEDQWDPSEIDVGAIRHMLTEGATYGVLEEYRKEILEWLEGICT